jgi:hypothetical protein
MTVGAFSLVGEAVVRVTCWPRKPDIPPADRADLEKLGPWFLRELLGRHTQERLFAGTHGPWRNDCYRWLDWKQAKQDWWIKVAAVSGAVAAVGAWLPLLPVAR